MSLVAYSAACAEFGPAERDAQSPPLAVPTDAEIDEAVGGRKDAHRRRVGVIVAGLAGCDAIDEIARGLEIHHCDLRLQQRGLHPLAAAGLLALGQRDQDAGGGIDAGRTVGHRNTGPHRSGTRHAGDPHQSAHALRDLVEPRAHAVGAALPEAGNRRENDARIHRAQRLVTDAHAVFDVGPEILDHDVGIFYQPQKISCPERSFRLSVSERLLRWRLIMS
jgi:hypothetical protein